MREAKVLITSENKSSAGIKSAIRDLLGIDDAAKKIGDTLKTAFTITAIAGATKKIAEFGFETMKVFGDVERTMIQLRTAVGGSESSFSRMNDLIDDMAGKTLSSKDEVEGLVAELATLGKSDADIERITEASVALSNVTEKSLNEAFTQINATFTGTSGKLSKLVPELEGMTAKQLEAGGAVDLLNQKFGAISDAMANGIAQQFSNLGKSADDFKEAIGENLAPVFSPMIAGIARIIEKWTEAIATHNRYRKALAEGNQDELAIIELEDSIKAKRSRVEQLEADKGFQQTKLKRFEQMGGNTADVQKVIDGIYKQEAELYQGIYDATKKIKELTAKQLSESPATVRPGAATSTGSSSEKKEAPAPFSMLDLQQLFMTEQAYRYAADDAKAPAPADESPRGFDMLAIQQQLIKESAYRNAIPEPTFIDKLSKKLGGLEGVFDNIGGKIGSVASEFITAAASLDPMKLLMVALEQVFTGIAQVLGPLIQNFLDPVISILVLLGNVIGQMLAPAFEILTPIVQGLAKLFTWLYNKVFVPVYNFSMKIFNLIYNAFADFINGILWLIDQIPFVDVGRVAKRDEDAGFLKEIDTGAGAAGSSGSSGSGASYTGSQPIIFNFYNQGNVVGSGGLEELAELINAIIKRNERYA
jgi:hypothetical protein